jgi:hypothetical protein
MSIVGLLVDCKNERSEIFYVSLGVAENAGLERDFDVLL